MARLSPEEVEELRRPGAQRGGGGLGGTLLRGMDRAARLGGLAAGTVAGAVGEIIPGVNKWTPNVYQSTPEAFKAFWDKASQGDWDAAIEAYQDEMEAGKGFWGTAEIAGAILPTGGPAFAGSRLISAAPKLAHTLGKALPATRGAVRARRGIEKGTEWLGKGLRAPWEAEEAVARGVMKTIRHPMTGPLAPAALAGRVARVGKVAPIERGRGRPPGVTAAVRLGKLSGKRSSKEWSELYEVEEGIKILEPDGWKGQKLGTFDVEWNRPITQADFERRLARSKTQRSAAPSGPYVAPVKTRGRPKKQKALDDLQEMTTSDGMGAVDIATRGNLGRTLANAWGIRHIMRHLNPAAVADTVEAKAIAGRNVLHFEATQKAEQAMSTLLRLGRQEQLFGKVGKDGRFVEGTLKGQAPNQARTYSKHPAIRELMTPEQKEWMDAAQALEAEKLAFLRKHGIDVNELTYEEGGSYAGRRIVRKVENGQVVEARIIGDAPVKVAGRRLDQTKQRVFRSQEEALDAGFEYLPEDDALFLNIEAAYKRVADKKFAEYVIENSPNLRRGARRRGREVSAQEVLKVKGQYGNADFRKTYFANTPEGRKAMVTLTKELTGTIPELKVLNAMSKVNALVRFMELNADMGQFMIQLLYLGGSRPTVWGKAINGFVRAWFDVLTRRNVYHERLIADNRDLLSRHRGLLTTIKGSEYTEAAEKGGLLRKIPGVGPAIIGTMNPFARAFNAAMDTAGIELAKSLDNTLKPRTAKHFADIDAFINEIRGLASSARMGVSPTMRAVENNLLLAPRYNRAIAALLWDTVADGGLRGKLARESLARSVTGLIALTMAFKMAEYWNKTDEKNWTMKGMAEHVVKGIDPTSPEFFTWEIGGTNIGPGTKVRSLVKLYADSLDDPGSLLDISSRNPFIRFARGNAAPVLSDTWDIFTGHNYIGEPTGIFDGWDEGFVDDIKKAGKTVVLPDIMPIWLHATLLESGGVGQRASRGAVEFFGGRAYPLRREQLAQEIATREGLGDYETLDARPKSLVDKLVSEEYKASGRDVYTGPKGPKLEQKDEADADLLESLTEVADKHLAAPIEHVAFAPRLARLAYNDARNVHRGYLYGVKWDEEKQRTIGGLLEQLYDMDQEREEPEEGTKDHRLWQYGQTFNGSVDPETGKLDFETLDKLQGKFWASLTQAEADEILRNIRVLEGQYDDRIQRMLDAGRYAGSVKLTLGGEDVSYYDLEDHKLVESYIAEVTGLSIIAIQEYLEKTIPEREAARKGPEGELLGKALDKAARKNGILWRLRKEFVVQAPSEWRQAMLDAGYNYQGKSAIEKGAFAKLKAGRQWPAQNYNQLYRQLLKPSSGR